MMININKMIKGSNKITLVSTDKKELKVDKNVVTRYSKLLDFIVKREEEKGVENIKILLKNKIATYDIIVLFYDTAKVLNEHNIENIKRGFDKGISKYSYLLNILTERGLIKIKYGYIISESVNNDVETLIKFLKFLDYIINDITFSIIAKVIAATFNNKIMNEQIKVDSILKKFGFTRNFNDDDKEYIINNYEFPHKQEMVSSNVMNMFTNKLKYFANTGNKVKSLLVASYQAEYVFKRDAQLIKEIYKIVNKKLNVNDIKRVVKYKNLLSKDITIDNIKTYFLTNYPVLGKNEKQILSINLIIEIFQHITINVSKKYECFAKNLKGITTPFPFLKNVYIFENEIIINPQTIHLSVSPYIKEYEIKRLLKNVKQLISFDCLGNRFITNKAFKYLVNLKTLNMTQCTQGTITDLAFVNLKKLTYLQMNDCNQQTITNKAFKYLANLKALEMSRCNQDTITDSAFINLKNLTHLQMNYCNQQTITNKAFCSLRKLEYMHMVKCNQITITDVALKYLTNLKFLNMEKCDQEEMTGISLKCFKNLKVLIITGCNNISFEIVLNHIIKLNNLQTLKANSIFSHEEEETLL